GREAFGDRLRHAVERRLHLLRRVQALRSPQHLPSLLSSDRFHADTVTMSGDFARGRRSRGIISAAVSGRKRAVSDVEPLQVLAELRGELGVVERVLDGRLQVAELAAALVAPALE